MKRIFYALLLIVSTNFSFGDNIWSDNFSNETNKGYKAGTLDVKGVDWSISGYSTGGSHYWYVNNGELVGSNTGNEATWESPEIDINCYDNIKISVDVAESGNIWSYEYYYVEYKIDNGSWTVFETNGSKYNDFNSVVATQSSLSGAKLYLRFRAYNTSTSRQHRFSNISITGSKVSNHIGRVKTANAAYDSVQLSALFTYCGSISDKGFVYATDSNPTINDNKISLGSAVAPLNTTLRGLSAGTLYYTRAYYTVAGKTWYSDINSNFSLPVWADNFMNETGKGANNGNLNVSGVNWSISYGNSNRSGKYWYINNDGFFEGSNMDAEGIWQSEVIAIACFNNLSLSMDISQSGADAGEYLIAEISTDGGSNWQTWFSYYGSSFSTSTESTSISGASLIIRVKARNSASNEYYKFGNIKLNGKPSTSFIEKVVVGNISKSSARFHAGFALCNGSISDKGFVFSTSQDPTLSDFKWSLGNVNENLDTLVTGLKSATTYYVRAYFTQKGKTTYSDSSTVFTTASGAASTLFWSDNFDSENGKGYYNSKVDVNGVDWSINYGNADYFYVNAGGQFTGANMSNTATWYSPSIDITCYSNVELSIDVSENGRLESSDSIRFEFRVDGGSWKRAKTNGVLNNDFTNATVSHSGINGNTLEIRWMATTNRSNEIMSVENFELYCSPYSQKLEQPEIEAVSHDGFTATSGFFYCGTFTDKGFVYAQNTGPTVNDSKVSTGTKLENISYTFTGLQSATTYYLRPYYVANGSTYYGSETKIKTAPADFPIIISEYGLKYSGSSPTDRYLEIYNKSDETVDLSDYTLVAFMDGANEKSGTNYALQLATKTTTLLPGKTFTLVYNNASVAAATKMKADLLTTNSALSFDGNDALALYSNKINGGLTITSGSVSAFGTAVVADLFGKIGQSSYWQSGAKSAKGQTLVRALTATKGDTKNPTSVDFATWEAASFTIDSLGFHNIYLSKSGVATAGKLCINRFDANGSNPSDSLVLSGDLLINKKLILKMGDIQLDSFSLKASSSVLSHGNKHSYIKINNTGRLITTVAANNTDVVNPIGRNPYLPVVLNCSNCQGVDFTIGVSQHVYTDPTNPVNEETQNVVGETWTIIPSATFSGNITLQFEWPLMSEKAGFDRSKSAVAYWQEGSSNAWTTGATMGAAQNGSQAGSYTQSITLNGMTGAAQYFFGVGGAGSALPVQYAYFTAEWQNQVAQLNWATASEINCDYYEIERSENGLQWQIIGRVQGSGNTINTVYYNYVDENPAQGNNYYRLKQVDFDGAFHYSKTVVLYRDATAQPLSLYPNPVVDVVFFSRELQQATVAVYTLNGVLIKETIVSGNRMDMSSLPAGKYMIVVSEEEQRNTQLLLKE
ncbi:T9SS type A sorting domain-containing protein [bacterium]|nr:T9SS type A sorting domain-containing protein [bacterium]